MKVNFKRGLQRIYISLLALIAIPVFLLFISNGCIFDDYQFTSNINVVTENKEIAFSDFYNKSIDPLYLFDFKCYPYQQKCIIKHTKEQLKNNQTYTYINNRSERKQYIIKMPTRYQYFYWQFKDFMMIICGFLIAYSLYLLLEQIIVG